MPSYRSKSIPCVTHAGAQQQRRLPAARIKTTAIHRPPRLRRTWVFSFWSWRATPQQQLFGAMASFMGRAGAGTGAASRALDPLRSRLRPAGSQRTYLSISHLRSLHIELVSLLYSAGATSAAPTTTSSADSPTLSARQNRRLVEILRSIAELVREKGGPQLNPA